MFPLLTFLLEKTGSTRHNICLLIETSKSFIMKKKIFIFLFAGLAGIVGTVQAQNDTSSVKEDIKSAAKKTGEAVEEGAEKVADKTAQVASSTKAAVVDKVYEGKVSPGGHRVYIDKDSKYYYIDEKGHKRYITKSQMKDKN